MLINFCTKIQRKYTPFFGGNFGANERTLGLKNVRGLFHDKITIILLSNQGTIQNLTNRSYLDAEYHFILTI